MKRKLLIISRRMDMGGVEISLINFLNSIDYGKYEVTLLLEQKEGILLSKIPANVNVEALKFKSSVYLKLIELDMKLNIVDELKFKLLLRCCRQLANKYDNVNYHMALKYAYTNLHDTYDLAIDFHGYGHFMTILMCKKIKAQKYATFIHAEKMDWLKNIKSILNNIDYYFCVSKTCREQFQSICCDENNKTKLFYNIVDIAGIQQKARENQSEISEDEKNVLVSVGRLEWEKGFDIAVDIAHELRKRNVKFKWYIIGNGSCYENLNQKIKECGLNRYMFLLGQKINPYPYINRADVYIQPSRHEGYGLAICEAKILYKPIISSDRPCIREQIESGKNGILAKLDVNDFSDAIENLLAHTELMAAFEQELKNNRVSFESQMNIIDEITSMDSKSGVH